MLIVKAKVADDSMRGTISMTFHFSESSANMFTNPAFGSILKFPDYRVYAVRVEKAG
jgi:predicted molibdopterin-dependent oxidoreductase YjgC